MNSLDINIVRWEMIITRTRCVHRWVTLGETVLVMQCIMVTGEWQVTECDDHWCQVSWDHDTISRSLMTHTQWSVSRPDSFIAHNHIHSLRYSSTNHTTYCCTVSVTSLSSLIYPKLMNFNGESKVDTYKNQHWLIHLDYHEDIKLWCSLWKFGSKNLVECCAVLTVSWH